MDRRRRAAVFAALAVPVVVLAGCTTATPPAVATAAGPTASTPTSAPVAAPVTDTDYDKALRYTRCMTENGAPMPDPVAGKALPISKDLGPPAPGTFVQLDMAPFDTCKHFLPATWPVRWDPAFIAKFRPFNECMRQHGQEVLEPDENGMVRDRTDFTVPRSAEYRAAEDDCRYLIPDG